jgi:hypothetical protein
MCKHNTKSFVIKNLIIFSGIPYGTEPGAVSENGPFHHVSLRNVAND